MERIYFLEKDHQYRGCETGLPYTPVSTVAKKFEPDVDWALLLRLSAKKQGMTPENLQKIWDFKKEIGTKIGTLTHEIFEQKLFDAGEYKGCRVVPYETDGDKKLQVLDIQKGCCYPELILSLAVDHLRIGGQSDVVTVDKNGFILVDDYKTDKVIEYKSKYRKFLKPPLQDLSACNYNGYGLKMSMYAYFMLRANPELKPGEITLIHLTLKRDEDMTPILENDKPIIEKQEIIKISYEEFLPYVKLLLNRYYRLTKPV